MEKIFIYQEGPDSASNTKYHWRRKPDEIFEDSGMFDRIVLDVPEDKIDIIYHLVNTFKGSRDKFNKRIQKLLKIK